MKKCVLMLGIALALAFAAPGFAALDLELTQGYDGAIPIAVVPFAGESAEAENQIANIVASDLSYCGRFRVLPSKQLSQFPHTAAAVKASDWQALKLDNLVVGKIERLSLIHI